MKLLRLKKAAIVLISLILAAACFTGCGKSQSGGEGTTIGGKVEEMSLPGTENVIGELKVQDDGSILMSELEHTDKYKSTGRVWKTSDGGKTWEKVYETLFEVEPVGDKVPETHIYLADEGWLVDNMDFDFSNGYSLERSRLYMKDAESTPEEIDLDWAKVEKDGVKFFTKEKIYTFSIWGEDSGLEPTKVYKLNMNTKEAKCVELPEVTGPDILLYDSRYVYILYYPEIKETPISYAQSIEMEREQITSSAKGIRYDMETGEILESDMMDKLAKKVLLLDLDHGDAMFCEVAAVQGGSGEEAYYVINNKGLIRIDDRGEELLYYEEKWESSDFFSGQIWSGKDGEVYIMCHAENEGDETGDKKLLKIS